MKLTILVLAFLALASPLAAQEEEARAFLSRWAAELSDVRSLRVEFSQTKRLRILRRPRVSRGEVLLDGPRLLMVVRDESGEVETELSVEEGEARIHYPSLRRVEVYPATADSASRAPFPMFGSEVEALPERYDATLVREDGRNVLELAPRDPESPIRSMRLVFEGTALREVHQTDRKGDSVSIAILAFEKNPELPPRALDFEIPEGTRIVRPLSPGSER